MLLPQCLVVPALQTGHGGLPRLPPPQEVQGLKPQTAPQQLPSTKLAGVARCLRERYGVLRSSYLTPYCPQTCGAHSIGHTCCKQVVTLYSAPPRTCADMYRYLAQALANPRLNSPPWLLRIKRRAPTGANSALAPTRGASRVVVRPDSSTCLFYRRPYSRLPAPKQEFQHRRRRHCQRRRCRSLSPVTPVLQHVCAAAAGVVLWGRPLATLFPFWLRRSDFG